MLVILQGDFDLTGGPRGAGRCGNNCRVGYIGYVFDLRSGCIVSIIAGEDGDATTALS